MAWPRLTGSTVCRISDSKKRSEHDTSVICGTIDPSLGHYAEMFRHDVRACAKAAAASDTTRFDMQVAGDSLALVFAFSASTADQSCETNDPGQTMDFAPRMQNSSLPDQIQALWIKHVMQWNASCNIGSNLCRVDS
jgi:hypothetical protein